MQPINLVCIHGNSLTKEIFKDIAVPGVNIITITLPGHDNESIGNVDSFISMVEHVYNQICGLERIALLGFSLGGHIAHHLLANVKPEAIITIAAPPISLETAGTAFMPNPLLDVLFKPYPESKFVKQLSEEMIHFKKEYAPKICDMYKLADPYIRHIIGTSLMNGQFLNEIKLLEKFTGPKLTIGPQNDTFVNLTYMSSLKNIPYRSVAGGHLLTIDNPDELNKLIKETLFAHKE